MKKIIWIIAAVSVSILVSCENEVEPGGTPVMNLSNEWWMQVYLLDGNGDLVDEETGYLRFLTSSTANGGADSLFINDFDGAGAWLNENGAVMRLKAKVACNVNDLSFTTNGTAVSERYTNRTVTVANGKVFPGGGLSTSGVKVDSIYFEIAFSNDPGKTYSIAGHGRTGFPEDEH